MKERYNSEKNLKNAFENYQMPIDNDAFENFKSELDKEEKRKKFLWWMFYGKIIAPFFFLGVAIISIFYYQDNYNTKETSASTTTTNTLELSIEDSNLSVEINDQNEDFSILQKGEKQEIESSSKVNNLPVFKKEKLITNANTGILKHQLTQGLPHIKEVILDSPVRNLQTTQTYEKSIPRLEMKQSVERFHFLNSLEINPHTAQNDIIPIYEGQVKPFVEKFKKYFYFNLGLGVTKEDNFRNYDPYFNMSKTNEILWQTSVAYQFTEKTSFELSFIRKNISLGYKLKNFVHTEKTGTQVTIFKVGMVNKLKSISPKIRLNLTNGFSIIKASQSFNEGADFSIGVSSQNVPDVISNINFNYQGLYSSNHFMYSSGLSLDYQLSKNVDLNFGAEYTLGLKPIAKANLNYLEGEGVLKNVETQSNSSFASISIGFKYKLKK